MEAKSLVIFIFLIITTFSGNAQIKVYSDTLPSIRYGDTILYIYPTDNAVAGWGGFNTMITAYNGAKDIWNGMVNTIAIVKQLGDNGGIPYAARVCDTLVAFGYNDWYLPSMHEMDTMYFKKDSIGAILILGDDGEYWTSTETDTAYAVSVYLGHFYLRWDGPKSAMHTCRCIRRNFDTVFIPDNNFKSALFNEGIDLNGDDIISDFEARLIRKLDVSCENDTSCYDIRDMTGIEAFINLDSLDCSRNYNLSVLDVSALVSLEYLNCSENALTSLDLSQNTSMKSVNLGENILLTEVCVWELPFPPAGVIVDTAGNPNLFFTTECLQNVPDFFQDGNKLKMFPNPANDLVYITVEGPINAVLDIINLNGKVIYSNKLNTGSLQIDVSLFSAGVYIVKITGDNARFYKKLVINKRL